MSRNYTFYNPQGGIKTKYWGFDVLGINFSKSKKNEINITHTSEC